MENKVEYPILEQIKNNPELKPDSKLIGENGNIFNLLAIASKDLKSISGAAEEMKNRVYNSDSYQKALVIISEYVNII